MKRTVFGVLVMSSLVGVGSVGVYYAQGKLAPKANSTTETDTPDDASARVPKPIPVTRKATATSAPRAIDPYANEATQVVASGDRYQPADYAQSPVRSAAARIPADDTPDVDQLADDRYAPYDATPAAAAEPAVSDIPDADQVAAVPSPSPFAGREPGSAIPANSNPRYADSPATADYADEPAAEPAYAAPADSYSTAPRHLTGDEAAPGEAGNPLRTDFDSPTPHATQTPSDRYGDEAFPAEQGAPQPYDNFAAEAAAVPLAGSAPPETEPVSEGTGRPGDPQLNGTQAPALTIEKTAPPEIQIGKPAKFTIKVRNAGTVTAHGVEIHDSIPQGTQLIDSSPPANRGPQGELLWELGALKPGEEQTVELQLMPTHEGEIGSVATVHFHAEASVRTLATKPMLAIEVLGPSKVNKGEQFSLRIKLSNPGTGAANGIMITESVPQGLTHPAGRELEFELGTLKPGETRELDLSLTAAQAGQAVNLLRAEGEASLQAEAQTEIEVVAPQLQVGAEWPEAPLPGAQRDSQYFRLKPWDGLGQEHRPGGRLAAKPEIRRGQQRRTVRRGDPCGLLEPRRTAAAGNRHGQAHHAAAGSRRCQAAH